MKRKKKTHILDVYVKDELVGSLTEQTNGAMEFKYHPSWLTSDSGQPISQSLPLTSQTYRGDEVRYFFSNLLPDNEKVRQRMAENLDTSSHDFSLLGAVGRECVGAFQFVPHNSPPPTEKKATGKELTKREIAEILRNLPIAPLGISRENDFRISIAGAQAKTGLLKMKSSWYLPTGTTPTSHIIKIPLGLLPNGIDLTTSIENEWLCLRLCEKLGLDVPQASIGQFEDQKCLIVERFDRNWSADKKKLLRIPQEDLCQALGVAPSQKYESDDGPGIKKIMDFLIASDSPHEDRAKFLRAQIVFAILGATDGHAKNFSIFLHESGFRLTPIYDVLSIYPAWHKRQIRQTQMKLAMSVGASHKNKLNLIFNRHWYESAKTCKFSAKQLDFIIADLVTRSQNILSLPMDLPAGFPRWLYKSMLVGIEEALERLKP